MSKLTVHMIGNAHLDPVWLWSYQAGVDEALATAYAAVQMLKDYPEFIFTRSDSWFYQIVEEMNPELFEEIRGFIAAGRWHVVGGWHVQPDCNLPTEMAYRKHIEIGKGHAKEKFGVNVRIGYNVDSFGHVGTLPRLLVEGGYESYIFMRPMKHENPNLSGVFRWQAADSDHEIVTFRIPHCYTTAEMGQLPEIEMQNHLKVTLEELDHSLGHIMCFYGVGDHGGGPTRAQLDWILENKNYAKDVELVFSHPQAYFDAIASQRQKLPIVKGELQYHAIGCYTAYQTFKARVHRVEHKLVQAEQVVEALAPHADTDAGLKLRNAWQDTLLNQFHDTYGGTCLRTSYGDCFAQLDRAWITAQDLITSATRRFSRQFPIVNITKNTAGCAAFFNQHNHPYKGYVEHEFWGGGFVGTYANIDLHMIDLDTNQAVPFQRIRSESNTGTGDFFRALVPMRLAPHQTQRLQIVREPAPTPIETDIETKPTSISNSYWTVKTTESTIVLVDQASGKPTTLWIGAQQDISDTWSHNTHSYRDELLGCFKRQRVVVDEEGPIRATLTWQGKFQNSTIRIRISLYANDPYVAFDIDLFWAQQKAVLKLMVEPAELFEKRIDGIAGGAQERALDGNEYPMHDWSLLTDAENVQTAIVSPDIFGLDANEHCVRLTLLRSPRYSLHNPDVPSSADPSQFTNDFLDQGEHRFTVLLRTGQGLETARLQRVASQILQQPIHWDPPYRQGSVLR